MSLIGSAHTDRWNRAHGEISHSNIWPAHLIRVGNILYGICMSGGPAQAGTVFQIDVSTGQETTLHQFTGGADGKQPASLVYTTGMLFGTTTYGGTDSGYGTVFEITF